MIALLIRHGENDPLKEGLLTCRLPGVHLNADGHAQALALAERLASVELAAVYASPMERTRETAQPIAERHGLEVRIHPGLYEVDCGRWSGKPLDTLRRSPRWRQIQLWPSCTPFPGGENSSEVQRRVVAAMEEIRAAHPKETVAVVSHADPLRVLIAHYVGLPLDLYRRLVIFPASLTVLDLNGLFPRLVCLNDTSHLPVPVTGKGRDVT